jgi:N-acetylmuramoyl-L-alanine amidase
MLRGDDVAELQSRLCSLGFDTGRVDGIFGDATAAALAEFQRNVQLPDDGVAGQTTIDELLRVSARHATLSLVTTVREAERRRAEAPTLRGRHVGVGEIGGLGTISAALARRLGAAGARVTLLSHLEESSQAAEANLAGVEVYIGVRVVEAIGSCNIAYYSGYTYESAVGRDLAEQLVSGVGPALGTTATTVGMTIPILRETRMPAVLLEIGPTERIVEHGAQLADALADAIIAWAESDRHLD